MKDVERGPKTDGVWRRLVAPGLPRSCWWWPERHMRPMRPPLPLPPPLRSPAQLLPPLPTQAGYYSAHTSIPYGETGELVAWFSDGIRVVDLADPSNPREVAYFVPPPRADPQGWWIAPDAPGRFRWCGPWPPTTDLSTPATSTWTVDLQGDHPPGSLRCPGVLIVHPVTTFRSARDRPAADGRDSGSA